MRTIKSTYLRTNKKTKLATLFIEHINVGNNFTYTHLINAIAERAEYDEDLQECINKTGMINLGFNLKIIANGNYSRVEDTSLWLRCRILTLL